MRILALTDKNGRILREQDIIFDDKDYWRIDFKRDGTFQMLSCTKGYKHNVQQKDVDNCVWVGTVKDNAELLECD